MVKGVYLTLLIGPGVPVPAPRGVVEALTAAEAQLSATGPGGFSLSFAVPKNSALLTPFLLASGTPVPLRVVLMVTINGIPEVIADGVMTDTQVTPGTGGQPGTLTVRGTDLSAVMDLIPFDGLPYPAVPVEARVLLILAKYAALGVIPMIIPRFVQDVDNPLDKIATHKGTDLQYLQHLAAEAGYVFHVEPGPAPGTTTAYWGPEIKVGVPQPALTVDTDSHTNVESLAFTFSNDREVLPIVMIHNQLTKIPIPIPIPNVSILNPPLGAVPPIPRRIEIVRGTAKRSIPQAILLGLGRAAGSADSVSGQGTLDVVRYGRVLKARRLVGVRGAGDPFDGLYYVAGVTHSLKRGEYKQSFTLSRNGLLPTVPKVPV
jgi:hypothetical protein